MTMQVPRSKPVSSPVILSPKPTVSPARGRPFGKKPILGCDFETRCSVAGAD